MATRATTAQQIAQQAQGTWNFNMNRPGLSPQARRAEAERAIRNIFGRDRITGEPINEAELREAFRLMAAAREAGQTMQRNPDRTQIDVPAVGPRVGSPASAFSQGRGNRCYQIAFYVDDNGTERRFTALLRTDRFSLSYRDLQNRVRFLVDKYKASVRSYDPTRADGPGINPVLDTEGRAFIDVLSVTDCE